MFRWVGFAALVLCAACDDAPVVPPSDHPLPIGDVDRGHQRATAKCTQCHLIDGRGGSIAPPMKDAAAKAAKVVVDYGAHITELRNTTPETYTRHQAAIERVLAVRNYEERLELWLTLYLRSPQFDNPTNKMAGLVLDDQEAADLVAWVKSLR